MRRKIKLLLSSILMACTVLVVIPAVEANAQVQTMKDGQYFDPEFYALNNPDVVNAFGLDTNALYKHYVQYGKKEGRLPYAVVTPAVPMSQTVYNSIVALQSVYPEGYSWNESNTYNVGGRRPWTYDTVSACQAFAYMVQDYAFGNKKIHFWDTTGVYSSYYADATYHDFETIYAALQPGDIIHTHTHSQIVLTKNDSGVTILEGNARINGGPGIVHWNRFLSKDYLRSELEYVESAY